MRGVADRQGIAASRARLRQGHLRHSLSRVHVNTSTLTVMKSDWPPLSDLQETWPPPSSRRVIAIGLLPSAIRNGPDSFEVEGPFASRLPPSGLRVPTPVVLKSIHPG